MGSSLENKKGKTLAIALPLSLIFDEAIIVIKSIILSKVRSKARFKVPVEAHEFQACSFDGYELPTCVSGGNGKGK